jgi:hypothetical protein
VNWSGLLRHCQHLRYHLVGVSWSLLVLVVANFVVVVVVAAAVKVFLLLLLEGIEGIVEMM